MALAVITIVFARPAAILAVLSLRQAALSRMARGFIAWFGPRGLNSLLFGLLVVHAGVPGAESMLAVAGLVVLVSVLAHGATATPLSLRYGQRVAQETLAEERIGTATGLFGSDDESIERLAPAQLKERLEGPRPPVIVDVRSRSSYERDGVQIPGSVRVLPDAVTEWGAHQLKDQPYVMYCT